MTVLPNTSDLGSGMDERKAVVDSDGVEKGLKPEVVVMMVVAGGGCVVKSSILAG